MRKTVVRTSSSPRVDRNLNSTRTGAPLSGRSRFFLLPIALALVLAWATAACSILATRPVQDMSDTTAAIQAAKEVQADTLAPEYYREATEWFSKARHEYRLKDFDLAQKYAVKARKFAEQAEFEAVRGGGIRQEPPPPEAAPPPQPYDYPTPTGTPASVYEQRVQQQQQQQQQQQAPVSLPAPAPNQ